MREAHFGDLVNFSSLLWQWMLDDKNNEALQIAIDRAFELYHCDLNAARMPFGDPDSFLENESIRMLSRFDKTNLKSLTEYLKSIQSTAQQDPVKTKLIARIADITNHEKFEKIRDNLDMSDPLRDHDYWLGFENWKTFEFSQKEFEILQKMLAPAPAIYAGLMNILLGQKNEQQNSEGYQYYFKQLEKIAVQTGKAVTQAGDVLKSAFATAYCAAMDRVMPNSATGFQSQSRNPRDFILQGALPVDASWEEESSLRFVGRKWPSLNRRVIDEVCRAFYDSQVLSVNHSAGKEVRITDRGSSSSAAAAASGSAHDGDAYVLLSDADESALATTNLVSSEKKEVGVILNLFGVGVISPLHKSKHALSIYLSLLTSSIEHKKNANVVTDSVQATRSEVSHPLPSDEIHFSDCKSSANFFSSAARGAVVSNSAASASSAVTEHHHLSDACDFCVVSLGK